MCVIENGARACCQASLDRSVKQDTSLVDGGCFGWWMEAALRMFTREEMKTGSDVPD